MSKPMRKPEPSRKHPDAIAWAKWINSREGFQCLSGRTSGEYLENRLWRAFMAGRGYGVAARKNRRADAEGQK